MNTERIKALTMAKVKNAATRKKPARFIVTLIAAVLIMTATAFAVGNYLSGFDRLREIVGEDMAEMLYPVENSTIIGEYTTDENIRVEVVAVGIFANVADIYITLEDLTGSRFNDGDVQASVAVALRDGGEGMILSAPSTVIDRSAEGVITLHSRQYSDFSIAGNELCLSLHRIQYNIVFEDGFGYISYDEINLDLLINFSIEMNENAQQTLTADELNLYLECCDATLTEVILTPYTIFLNLGGEDFDGVSPRVTINTTDGPIAVTGQDTRSIFSFIHDNSNRLTGLNIVHVLPVDFLDINTVISVEIAGKTVTFN